MRSDHPEAFRDIPGQQIAMLKTALARPAFDMEINPTCTLMPLRRAQPSLLSIREAGPMKSGLGEGKTSETKGKSAKFHEPKIHEPSMSAMSRVSNEFQRHRTGLGRIK